MRLLCKSDLLFSVVRFLSQSTNVEQTHQDTHCASCVSTTSPSSDERLPVKGLATNYKEDCSYKRLQGELPVDSEIHLHQLLQS